MDVTYYRADANNISIPGSMLELEQIVNANPYKYSIGKGRASLKLFANLIEEVAQKENLELSKYNRDTFKKLKYILDSKLESIKSNFWRKGEANFHQLGIPIAIQINDDKDINRTLTESIDKKDYLCLAIPKKVNNLETALFVINELCAPKMRMKRVDSILKEQLTVDDSLPENIDSNYIIRYYDDFKYCKE